MENKNTKIINLFGAPGAGKSTGATYLFSQLKLLNKDAEYISEFAKDKVWEKNDEVFKNQLYLLGKQAFKISRVFGKVDYIVTDSPVLLPLFYAKEDYVKNAALGEFEKYIPYNLNFFINRVKIYNPNGRHQTEEQSNDLMTKIETLLQQRNIPYTAVNGDIAGYTKILAAIQAA
jgi:adenylate kinase family enzyme